jgi:hypothetical protein
MRDNQRVSRSSINAMFGEPLLQFLLIGGLLFLIAHFVSPPTVDQGHLIVISAEEQAALAAAFERENQRPPDVQELQDLVDDYVRTEICYREAIALGLDQDDLLIRDHLRSKFELLLDDGTSPPEPDAAQLQQFLMEHQSDYRTEDALSFMQIYLDPAERGPQTELDARLLLDQLSPEIDSGTVQALSDPGPLPSELPLVALSEVGWQFDADFAGAIDKLEPGSWQGPVQSSYGWHLVLIRERQSGRDLTLAEIREEVERDWIDAQLRARLDERITGISSAYTVMIDNLPHTLPDADPAGQGSDQ